MTAPLAGPLDTAPEVTHEQARAMLDDALDDLQLGVWDAEVHSWIDFADPAYMAAVASWLRRSWAAGLETGRAERREERA